MPKVIVRKPTPGEVEKAADVAYEAFAMEREHWQRLFHTIARLFGEQFIVIGEVDGQIASTLICTPGPIYVGEAAISHSAVGAVSTLSDFRQRGLASEMLRYTLKLLSSEGIYASSLWSALSGFYRKFGWEYGGEVRSYSADAKVFTDIGNADMARGASAADLEAMKQIYEYHALNYNCCTKRSDDWWKEIIRIDDCLHLESESGRGVIVNVDDDGHLTGYSIYEAKTEAEGQSFFVREMVCLEPIARRNMLARFASINSEAKITFAAPVDDLFFHELENPRLVQAVVRPTFMFRITDPQEAIKRLQPPEDISCDFSLSIKDPVFEQGFEFGVEVSGGEVEVVRLSSNPLQMDIQTFAKIYSGYYSIIDAWNLGKIKIDGDTIQALANATSVFSSLLPYRSWIEPG